MRFFFVEIISLYGRKTVWIKMSSKAAQAIQSVDPVKSRVIALACNLVCTLAVIIPLFIVISSGDDCDEPINLWLFVEGIIFIVSFLLLLIELIVFKVSNEQKTKKYYRYSTCPVTLFSFAWFILGNVWLFGDENCEDDWEDGYTFALALIIINYIAIGFACCAVLCLCCCLGALIGAQQQVDQETAQQIVAELQKIEAEMARQRANGGGP